MRYELRKVFSFLDYIMGGLQLNCSVAIDFTGKDGLLFMNLVVIYFALANTLYKAVKTNSYFIFETEHYF